MKRAVAAATVALVAILAAAVFAPLAEASFTSCDRPPDGFLLTDSSGVFFVRVVPGAASLDRAERTIGLDAVSAIGSDSAESDEPNPSILSNGDAAKRFLARLDEFGDTCQQGRVYGGPEITRPTVPGTAYGFDIVVRAPAHEASNVAVSPVAQAVRDADLAHSGSQSFVLAYFGAGLIAFGAGALGMRRRIVLQQHDEFPRPSRATREHSATQISD